MKRIIESVSPERKSYCSDAGLGGHDLAPVGPARGLQYGIPAENAVNLEPQDAQRLILEDLFERHPKDVRDAEGDLE
jgi:hypothetical protein